MPCWTNTDSPTTKSSPSTMPSATPSVTSSAPLPPQPQHQPRHHPGPSCLCRRARRDLARATAAKAATSAAEKTVQNDDAAPHPRHQGVSAHQAAAAHAGQVSAERADDGVPHPRDHDPVTAHLAAVVQA